MSNIHPRRDNRMDFDCDVTAYYRQTTFMSDDGYWYISWPTHTNKTPESARGLAKALLVAADWVEKQNAQQK